MSESINPTAKWVDVTEVPRDGEGVDAADVKIPVSDLLGNDKYLLKLLSDTNARLDALEAARKVGYSLSVPSALAVEPNKTYTVPVGIARNSGDTSTVDLDVLALPAGITATFAPDPVPGDQNAATLTLTTAAELVAGQYDVTLVGRSAEFSASAVIRLNAAAATLPATFTIDSPGIVQVSPIEWAVKVNVQRQGGFSSPISFSSPNLPSGLGAAFNPTGVSGSESRQDLATQVTIVQTSPIAPGTYNVNIYATGGGITRTLSYQVTVQQHDLSQGDFDVILTVGPTQDILTSKWADVEIVRKGGFTGPVTLNVPQPPDYAFSIGGVIFNNQGHPTVTVDGSTAPVVISGTRARISTLDAMGWMNSGITVNDGVVSSGIYRTVTGTATATINGGLVKKSFTVTVRYGTR